VVYGSEVRLRRYRQHRADFRTTTLELFPIEVDRKKALAICFCEHLYPTADANWTDDAVGTKIHAVADEAGRIVAFTITAGQLGDARAAHGLLGPLPPADQCLADGGYDSNGLRAFLVARGTQPIIPNNPTRKHPHPFDRATFRARNLIERAFCRLKDRDASQLATTSSPSTSPQLSPLPPHCSGGPD
jgi:transposase